MLIPKVASAFNDEHDPIDPESDTALEVLLDDLAWWSALLERARNEGQLRPGVFRAREAAAARAAAAVGEGL